MLINDVSKAKSNYFIVRSKVDQRGGQLSLPYLKNFVLFLKIF